MHQRYVEQKIYDGFFSSADQARMDAFHRSSWEARPAIVSALEDPRRRELGMRLIHAERPDVGVRVGPVPMTAASLLAKGAFAPSIFQHRHLSSGVLVVCGNACVADQRRRP